MKERRIHYTDTQNTYISHKHNMSYWMSVVDVKNVLKLLTKLVIFSKQYIYCCTLAVTHDNNMSRD